MTSARTDAHLVVDSEASVHALSDIYYLKETQHVDPITLELANGASITETLRGEHNSTPGLRYWE